MLLERGPGTAGGGRTGHARRSHVNRRRRPPTAESASLVLAFMLGLRGESLTRWSPRHDELEEDEAQHDMLVLASVSAIAHNSAS